MATAAATAAAADPAAPAKGRSSKLPLLMGLVLAILGGAGGYYAVGAGLLGGGRPPAEAAIEAAADPDAHLPEMAATAFVPLPPLTVNIRGGDTERFLRFVGQVEVAPAYLDEVTALVPRVVDVLNGYLRAVEPADLADPAALIAIRSQLLRRVQVVAGGDRVRDLLVMEFVVN